MANSVVSVTTTAKRIILKNPKRIGLEILNDDASLELRIAVDEATCTVAKGIPIAAGEKRIETLGPDREYEYWGDYWAITASGTVSVAVMEQERVT